jgi:regulator of protease activity HflC (stomatin/prohibitin superfamily)
MTMIEPNRVIVNGAPLPPQPPSRRLAETQASRARFEGGWRAGKPVEDPEKLKKWGRISARPSEYLIHMRRGKVLTATSGQGASCFKLPGDAVAVVPTTVQKLRFVAEQVTREKVGVEVTGVAVYRIAEPLIAFRMVNFSYPERAQEKLEELLGEMFIGAVRRLVANLSVEECLSRRKEGIAAELLREVIPVVSGQGKPDDATDAGWGVVMDTVEIQDVRVLSEAVFGNMQAKFRKEQERAAREAALTTERAVKLGEAEAERSIELTRLAAQSEVQKRKRETEEEARLGEIAAGARVTEARIAQQRASQQAELGAAQEAALAKLAAEVTLAERRRVAQENGQLAALAAETTLAQRRREAQQHAELTALAAEAQLAEARIAHAQRAAALQAAAEIERVRLQAEAEAARHAAAVARARQEIEEHRLRAELTSAMRDIAEAELGIAELSAKKQALAHDLELARARAFREIENTISPETVQLTVAQKLPELAAAFQQQMGQVHVTAVDGANPFGFVAAAVEGVLGLARAAGLPMPATSAPRQPAS